jgi:DNA polymerase III alpha subunit
MKTSSPVKTQIHNVPQATATGGLRQLCEQAIGCRYGYDQDVCGKVIVRLEEELHIIHVNGFTDYFLILNDIINFTAENHILTGPGRGNAVGSIVCYLLGITDVDPLEHDLIFEQFINPEKIEHPNIEIDICEADSSRIIEYIQQKYGKSSIAGIDFLELDALTIIQQTVDKIKESNSLFDIRKIPLDDNKTFTLIRNGDTKDIFLLNSKYGTKSIDTFDDLVMAISLSCPGPMQYIPEFVKRKQQTTGTFSLFIMSSRASNDIFELKFQTNDGTTVFNQPIFADARIKRIFAKTYGMMVYQEQFVEMIHQVSGMPKGTAVLARRTINKFDLSCYDQFAAGCRNNNIAPDTIEDLWAAISKATPFLFSKAHGVAYALITYRMAYLKAHYSAAYSPEQSSVSQ